MRRHEWRDAIWASDLDGGRLLNAALAFSEYLKPDGTTWVGTQTGMARARCSRSRWFALVAELVELGWLLPVSAGRAGRDGGRAATYRAAVPGARMSPVSDRNESSFDTGMSPVGRTTPATSSPATEASTPLGPPNPTNDEEHDVTAQPADDAQMTFDQMPEPPHPKPKRSRSLAADDPRRPGWEREFQEGFWPQYPRKVGKPAALKAWLNARQRASIELIAAGLMAQRPAMVYDMSHGRGEFVPHPSRWLNDDRWEDEATAARAARITQAAEGSNRLAELEAQLRERRAAQIAARGVR